MTIYVFQELSQTASRKGICPVCGKRGVRSRTFTMTENPWNRNDDGSVRTRPEIRAALRIQAAAWAEGDFVHARCEKQHRRAS